MEDGGRYQSQDLYLQQGDIRCHRGVDPLTGLSVLIYTFPGRPTAQVGSLESENVPGILASSFDGTSGQLVTAYSPHYGLLATGESALDDRFALEVLRGVRDAARAGVVHGDIRAGRLLYAQGHVLVEGYGVPWSPSDADVTAPEVAAGGSPTLESDVYGVAATLLLLAGANLSGEVTDALRSALAKEPKGRPTAESLYARIRRASGGAVAPPARSFDDLTLPTGQQAASAPPAPTVAEPEAAAAEPPRLSATRSDFRLDLDFELDVDTPPPDPEPLRTPTAAPPPRPPGPPPGPPPGAGADEPEPITLQSDPGLSPVPGRSTRDSSPGFVKDLPPGATYRPGNLDDSQPAAPILIDPTSQDRPRRRPWRGPLLVVLALAVAAGLVALAFLSQRPLAPTPAGGSGVDYVVAVQVVPANLPPVDLYVVKSPAGSAWPAGTNVCRAPCRLVLDRPGDWQFRAVFQGRQSAVASVKLPGQRSFTVSFASGGGSSSP